MGNTEVEKYKIGFKSSYINDHKFKHVVDISSSVAMSWIKSCDEIDLDDINDWTNKMFFIVANEHGKYIAINNQDGVFSVRILAV